MIVYPSDVVALIEGERALLIVRGRIPHRVVPSLVAVVAFNQSHKQDHQHEEDDACNSGDIPIELTVDVRNEDQQHSNETNNERDDESFCSILLTVLC